MPVLAVDISTATLLQAGGALVVGVLGFLAVRVLAGLDASIAKVEKLIESFGTRLASVESARDSGGTYRQNNDSRVLALEEAAKTEARVRSDRDHDLSDSINAAKTDIANIEGRLDTRRSK